MACLLYNTGRCLQLRMFNCPNFGVHFIPNLYKTAIPLRHNPTNMRIVQVLFDMLKMQ